MSDDVPVQLGALVARAQAGNLGGNSTGAHSSTLWSTL
jgi:hypothetical protein